MNSSIERVKEVINSLKMGMWASLDAEAQSLVQGKIKNLPNSEEFERIAQDPVSFKNIKKEIGKILDLIEEYNTSSLQYKSRYKANKGINPRYPVLKRSASMNIDKKNVILKLASVSRQLDAAGHEATAEEFLVFAEKFNNGEVGLEDLKTIRISSSAEDFIKEAGLWDNIKGLGQGLKGLGQGLGQGAKNVADYGKQKAQQVVDYGKQKAGQAVDAVGKAYHSVVDPAATQKAMFHTVNNMKKINDLMKGTMNQLSQTISYVKGNPLLQSILTNAYDQLANYSNGTAKLTQQVEGRFGQFQNQVGQAVQGQQPQVPTKQQAINPIRWDTPPATN